MTRSFALPMLFLLGLSSAAQAQGITSVYQDHRTYTTTTPHGTATTEVVRNGNTITATTKFQPNKTGYQPMGGGSGYTPMGGSGGYRPMGQ